MSREVNGRLERSARACELARLVKEYWRTNGWRISLSDRWLIKPIEALAIRKWMENRFRAGGHPKTFFCHLTNKTTVTFEGRQSCGHKPTDQGGC